MRYVIVIQRHLSRNQWIIRSLLKKDRQPSISGVLHKSDRHRAFTDELIRDDDLWRRAGECSANRAVKPEKWQPENG